MLRRIRKSHIWIALFSCLVVVLLAVSVALLPQLSLSHKASNPVQTTRPQIDSAIPVSVQGCFPEKVMQAELLGKVEGPISYFYVGIYGASRGDYREHIFSLKQSSCNSLNGSLDEIEQPIGQFVDQAIARELSLQRYRGVIQKLGGKEHLEAALAEEVERNKGRVYLDASYFWALKQLNVVIPTGLEPINSLPQKPEFKTGAEHRE